MKRLILVVLLFLASCAPVATVGRDLVERTDGATLTYVEQGLAFNSGEATAFGVILVARGEQLVLLAAPEGASCSIDADVLDCRLGDVTGVTTVNLTGLSVVASATYRRDGANAVYQVFAR